MSWRVGIDIGGTFTDLALQDEQTGELLIHKCVTTPEDPSEAALTGLTALLNQQGIGLPEISQVIHGTTLASNIVLERKGKDVALIVTRGFRDVLKLARQKRWDTFNLTVDNRIPLIPRSSIFEITERLAYDGSVVTPLDGAEAREVIRELVKRGAKSVAVCLVHSYRNPRHEQQVASIIREEAPTVMVSLSCDVAPVWREYERTNTTACNAYVMPAVKTYLEKMQKHLRSRDYKGDLYIMQSSGGAATAEQIIPNCVRLLESGPAAGALVAAFYGESTGIRDLVSFDMGGTTCKSCVIRGGIPLMRGEIEVDRLGLKPASGLAIAIPSLDLIEIGSGGGSIAQARLGIITVGPESAGADPGPICYGRGGTEPTVTDADLILGYLNPAYFAGGLSLDMDAAAQGIAEKIAKPLGIGVAEAAWGIHNTVNLSMELSTRAISLEKGHDTTILTFVAFGGAGPIHGARVAKALKCPRILLPTGAGVASAIGLLVADVRFNFVRTTPVVMDDEQAVDLINSVYDDLEVFSREVFHEFRTGDLRLVKSADMRYSGQGHEIETLIPSGRLATGDIAKIREAFHRTYYDNFGYSNSDQLVEGITWKLTTSYSGRKVRLKKLERRGGDVREALKEKRKVYFPECKGYIDCDIYDRYCLFAGDTVHGPAVVEEKESTAVILPGDVAEVDEWGNLLVRLKL